MSAPASSRNSAKTAAPADGDHRKRRRNRTTQSCLNCHATKRMCDRKRPCSRCSQLGISGNCVYEVADPNHLGKDDEDSRLMKRIAELEGMVRELKNRPHNRSVSSQEGSLPASGRTSPGSLSDNSPHFRAASPPMSTLAWSSPPSPSYYPSGPVSTFPASNGSFTSSWSALQNEQLSSLVGLTDRPSIRNGDNCGCLREPACYSAVLDLSLRLRKATEVLARSPRHSSNFDCTLNNQIVELDTFTKDVLLDVSGQDSTSTYSHGLGPSSWRADSPPPSGMLHQPYTRINPSFWNLSDSDNLMSWVSADK
ncbi:hypothetical protein B0H11DRAFT_1846940 [Mycena galericulata]|nr:hypothetical protein B0H11DRAFT_1846940 [Mycena galericulata]